MIYTIVKRLVFISIVSISLTVKADLTTGLLGHWTLDDDAPSTTAQDDSGNSNHGILTNMDVNSAWVDGQYGKALKFDGVDDSLIVGNALNLKPVSGLSIVAWIYKKGNGDIVTRVLDSSSNIDRKNGYRLSSLDSKVKFEIGDGSDSWNTATTSSNLALNTWTHVVATFDGYDMKIYMDGVLDVTENVASNSSAEIVLDPLNHSELHAGTGSASNHTWFSSTNISGYTGDGVLITPSNGVSTGDSTIGPRADYIVNFPSAGTYYVWIRMYVTGSQTNSVHVGLNGVPVTYGRAGLYGGSYNWTWARKVGSSIVSISVPSAGEHTLNLWMREDGTPVDKIILTTNLSYSPSGTGPDFNSAKSISYDDLTVEKTIFSPSIEAGNVTSQLNPLIYLPLNEASGSTAVDAMGNQNGSYIGGVGFSGDGVDLTGSKYIELPNTVQENLVQGTYSMWIRPSANVSLATLLSVGANTATNPIVMGLRGAYGDIQSLHNGHSIESDWHSYSTNIWQHVVYTFGPAGSKFYIDGTLDPYNNNSTALSLVGNSNKYYLGVKRSGANYSSYFYGRMSEVSIFSRVLNVTEIASITNAGHLAMANSSSGGSFEGNLDELRIYDRALTAQEVALLFNQVEEPEPSDIDGLHLTYSQQGIYCFPHRVEVGAYKDGVLKNDFEGSILLSTNTGSGTWQLVNGHGTVYQAASTGKSYYKFSPDDGGVAQFALEYTSGPNSVPFIVSSVNRDIANDDDDGSVIRNFSAEGSIQFSPFGFVIEPEKPEILLKDGDKFEAGDKAKYLIKAYGIDEQQGNCGIIKDYDGKKQINLFVEYVDPTSGTLVPYFKDDAFTVLGGNARSVEVDFSDGIAKEDIEYADVGKLRFHAFDYEHTDYEHIISGASDPVVIVPHSFEITGVANMTESSPQGDDHDGLQFAKAGEAFYVKAIALNKNGDITPNFGLETTPESIRLEIEKLEKPSGGEIGTLVNADAFVSGGGALKNTTVYYDEVGVINIRPRLASGSYLGMGDVVGETYGDKVGRFYPASLQATQMTTPSFATACQEGGFTYLGQDFSYVTRASIQVTAHSVQGKLLKNYRDNFNKLPSNLVGAYSYNNQANVSLDTSNASQNRSEPNAWTREYTFSSGSGFKLLRPSGVAAKNTAPFNAEIALSITVTDNDSPVAAQISGGSLEIGDTSVGGGIAFNSTNEIRHGRLQIGHSSGSELVSLNPTLEVQYFNGTQFVRNTLDSCTALPTTNLSKKPSTLQSQATVSSASNDVYYANKFYQGLGVLELSPSTARGFIDVTVPLNSTPWLQYDWAQGGGTDNIHNNDPIGRSTFGIFSGNKKVIYFREVH